MSLWLVLPRRAVVRLQKWQLQRAKDLRVTQGSTFILAGINEIEGMVPGSLMDAQIFGGLPSV